METNQNNNKKEESIKINGISIRVRKIEDIVRPVYSFLGLNIGDEKIIERATKYLMDLVFTNNLEKMRSYLWIDPIVNVGTMKLAVIYCSKKLDKFSLLEARTGKEASDREEISTPYSRWIAAQGNLIVRILKQTKEEDAAIQHWLNYEDFILELLLTQSGCKIIAEIYELRGLDFFLFHYVGGETSAINDKALFDNAMKIPIAFTRIALTEEATLIEKEIINRQKGLIRISNQYSTIGRKDNADFVLENLRVQAERFWNDYLSHEVWVGLANESRIDLIDSFISEIFLENGILHGWSQVVFSLCKVIEREISRTLFKPYIGIISKSFFVEPDNISSSKLKQVQSRKLTFEIIIKCAKDQVKPPTLGQLIFMLRFWNDPIMDECTTLFKDIRKILEKHCSGSTEHIKNLAQILVEKHPAEGTNGESASIVELRNASAHPGKEESFSWSNYINWLKATIGRPPRRILNILIRELSPRIDTVYKDKMNELNK